MHNHLKPTKSNSMEYQYQPDFFLQKESFRNWVEGRNVEDCLFWDRWFRENPGQLPAAVLAARMHTGLPTPDSIADEQLIEAGWKEVNKKIDRHEAAKRTVFFSMRRIAASMAFLITALSVWYILQPVSETYATGYSSRRTVLLSDGTEILLNANTRLTAKRSWRYAVPREVWVDGEAFFHVNPVSKENHGKNFIVHTHDMDITVTGTKFNVNTRSRGTRVFLSEGKVDVALIENPSRRIMRLDPGEVLSYSGMQDPDFARKENVNSDGQLAWKSGYFSFDNTTLSDVVDMVYQTHGVRISVEDSLLLGETISGRVPNNNVDELVNAVSKLFNLKHTRNGTGIVLSK